MPDLADKSKEWRKVFSGLSSGLIYETWEYCGEYVHFAEVVGRVGKEERFPFIRDTVEFVKPSGNYFCLVDNSGAHESVLSYEEMMFFGEMMQKAGVRHLYNIVVTSDPSHPKVARLIKAVSEMKQFDSVTFSAPDYETALDFIKKEIHKMKAPE